MAGAAARRLDNRGISLIIEGMNKPPLNSAAGGATGPDRSAAARRHHTGAALLLFALLLFLPPSALAVFGDDPENEGPRTVSAIEIEGNRRTDTGVVLRQLGFAVGDTFSYELMDAAWDRLEDCGYFAFVDMEQEPTGDGEVVVRIFLEEEMTTSYNLLLGYTERHRYELGGYIQDTNLRGKGETLRFDFTGLYTQRARLNWTRPWLFGLRGLEGEVAGSYFAGNFVYRPTDFREARGGLRLRYAGNNGLFTRGGIDFRSEDYRDTYVWPVAAPGEVLRLEERPARTQDWLTAGLSFGFDSRDNPLYPLRGLYAEAGFRRWVNRSDNFADYTESFADVHAFAPMPWHDHVLALRCFGRQTSDAPHLNNRLYWGGAQTLRGYRLGLLEGHDGLLLSAEYRIPLFIMPISVQGELLGFGLHIFYDWGKTWWDSGVEVADEPLYGYGGGAHFNFMSQQFRFEGACNRDGDWRFQFADTFNF